MFDALAFRHPFRKYQRMMLDQIETGVATPPYHLVAPPGSGKTIVGLELIRRLGRPAVVFAPTTTIQLQWRAEAGMFTDDRELVRTLTSVDPECLAAINCFTYQLISTTGGSEERLAELGRREWLADLVAGEIVDDEEAARARLATLAERNRSAYSRAVRRRARLAKRRLLREGSRVAPFLHANARDLIDRLVGHGVTTVVLDECHHLLDYWALVLRHLIDRIEQTHGQATVIGLTATLPSPDGDREYENYTSLLGEVDFEVPTPAVVKEGDLAPYRDLVHFVEPTPAERAFLDDVQTAFTDAVVALLDETGFGDWLVGEVAGGDDPGARYAQALREDAAFAVAAARFCAWDERALPRGVDVPAEVHEGIEINDWGVLIERFGLRVLKTSEDAADHERFDRLRAVLRGFGLTLTERGLRQSRSAGDLVLAFSEAKDEAVARIIAREHADLGDRLRAVVVTDFERASSAVGRSDAPLAADAGSAQRVFRRLVADRLTRTLDPVLVTGRVVKAGAEWADTLVAFFNDDLARRGYRAAASVAATEHDDVVEIAGEGPDWSSRSYVAMVTDAFDRGLVRCLVGTRGLFGEGWDSLALNTLVDLTSVTTSTSVQQLRGRSIRLDPDWPRKVAHNWDVICVAPEHERGDADLRRFERRHTHYWGITPVSSRMQAVLDGSAVLDAGDDVPLGPELAARVTRGVIHVDERLAMDLAFRPFERVRFKAATRRCVREIGRREQTYDAWAVGEDYSNFSFSATRLAPDDLRFRTVHTVRDTVRQMVRRLRAALWAGGLYTLALLVNVALPAVLERPPFVDVAAGVMAAVGMGVVATVGLSARSAWRLGKRVLLEQPSDAILLDAGRAVLAGLRDAGLVSSHLVDHYVRVVVRDDGTYEVLLDYASPGDAATFVQAYRQVFGPVRDPRYLILRDDSRLGELGVGAAWLALRPVVRAFAGGRPAYHPVPDVLGANRERAEAFAAAWQREVGGGELVYTRSEEGWRTLVRARAADTPDAKALAFEVWT